MIHCNSQNNTNALRHPIYRKFLKWIRNKNLESLDDIKETFYYSRTYKFDYTIFYEFNENNKDQYLIKIKYRQRIKRNQVETLIRYLEELFNKNVEMYAENADGNYIDGFVRKRKELEITCGIITNKKYTLNTSLLLINQIYLISVMFQSVCGISEKINNNNKVYMKPKVSLYK